MIRTKNVRNSTKFKRSIKAISPVIATLLMIAIAVVASLVVYAWVTGYIGGTTTTAGKAIQIQSFAPMTASNTLVIYVQNVGQGDVKINQGQSVYVDSILEAISAANPNPASWPLTIPVGQTVGLTVALPTGYVAGDKLNIKVTTTDGTFMTITGTGITSTGVATASINLGAVSGPAGSSVSVSGSNFAATSAITVKFDGTTMVTVPTPVTSSAAGAISGVTFTVPSGAAPGSHTVTVTDASSNTATLTYTVTSAALATPTVSVPTLAPVSPITLGASVTASLTVSGSAGTPTGTVTFQVSTDSGATWNPQYSQDLS